MQQQQEVQALSIKQQGQQLQASVMATTTARKSRLHQLQQLLSQLSAAPDLAQFDSADTYSKLRQLAKQHSASNTELLLLQSSALRNGLQLLQ